MRTLRRLGFDADCFPHAAHGPIVRSFDFYREGRRGFGRLVARAALQPARLAKRLGCLALLAVATLDPATAQDAPQQLKWADLVPQAEAPGPGALKSFLANRPKAGAPDHMTIPEGRWLSPGAQPQASAGPPPVVEALDGKRVRIGGYVVPLDFDATKVKEFLLVPFVGACIHVPPPPPNQIVYVKSAAGFDVKGSFDPVWVTGKMQTKVAFTGLAEAGYSLEAEKVEARSE
jgi:hypothetical protein